MFIKEYRIPLPMSVDEYKVAQLYMIQKKSLQESTGSGSAVEIIENKPYENGPGGSGQYTKKIFHIGSHLPAWLKSLLPKTALRVEEEAWNAYPYTKTRHTCPFIEKFFIDIETYYLPDNGQTENIFKLSSSERKNAEIDLIDPIKDTFPAKDYKKEEDPHIYVSSKTGRGPLADDWLAEYNDDSCLKPVMCAYKLIRVEFKYWGMQSKIESFIQNGIRNPMLVGHRQAWAWQDEWHGLTMDDIRELEKKAQIELAKKMGSLTTEGTNVQNQQHDSTEQKEISDSENDESSSGDNDEKQKLLSRNLQVECQPRRRSDVHSLTTRRRSDVHSLTMQSNQEKLLEIHMKHIEQSESDDEDEFFDCKEEVFGSTVELNDENYDNQDGGSVKLERCETITENRLENRKTLIFVIQGGSLVDHTFEHDSKQRDFETFERVFTSACNYCYPGSRSSVLFECVECPSISKDIMEQLKELHATNVDDDGGLSNSFPFTSLPLLLYQSPEFLPAVDDMIKRINTRYKDIMHNIKSSTQTEVYMIADCIGGTLLYQALSSNSSNYNDDTMSMCSEDFGSQDSVSAFASFDFAVSGVFTFGSPIGLIAFKQKLSTGKELSHLQCGQLYNLFHPFDPMSSRVEPLLDKSCSKFPASPVPAYQDFPYNNDIEYNYSALYEHEAEVSDEGERLVDRTNKLLVKQFERKISTHSIQRTAAYNNNNKEFVWWGTKRIDYVLTGPEGLQQFPVSTLMSLCYNSYWESKDLVTFILWQILYMHRTVTPCVEISDTDHFTLLQPKEKWLKKRTKMKIKNMNANHRANDIITLNGAQQFITGKFAYGPVDLAALTREKVDMYIARRPQLNDWQMIGSEQTDSHGKLMFSRFASDQEPGVYSIKMVVRGDHSQVTCNMAILTPQTEAVVFSIDGSFLASYSLRGVDPRIRGGAVDVVRYWQELGYLIIYVSSRLLFQKGQVMSWLIEHKFPFGIVSFCEHVSTDFQRHKIDFLKNIIRYENVSLHAAYGSSRDISVYISHLNLQQNHVFLIGKKTKSKKADSINWITNGYAEHLKDVKKSALSRRSHNKNAFLALGDFGQNVTTDQQQNRKKSPHGSDDESVQNMQRNHSLGHSFIRSFRHKSPQQQQ